MFDRVLIEAPTRGVRVLGAIVVAALALAPLVDAPVSHSPPCGKRISPPAQESHEPLRRRTPGLNPEYLQRELR